MEIHSGSTQLTWECTQEEEEEDEDEVHRAQLLWMFLSFSVFF